MRRPYRALIVAFSLLGLVSCTYKVVDERGSVNPTQPTPIVVTAPAPAVVPTPTVALFTAEPSTITLGSPIVLRWDVTLPPGTAINTPVTVRVDPAPGTVQLTGAAIVQPFARGLYTSVLTAETTGGRTSRVVQVLVQ